MVISLFAALRPAPARRLPLEQIRQRLHGALSDCRDAASQRVIYKINAAAAATELWLLRCDLHQCIARAHDQAEATRRINALLDAFEGWLPAHQLTEIQTG